MEFNQNIVQGKWREIKGEIQKAWGKLTSDELEKTKGDLKAIGGLIQSRYGATQENYSQKLADIVRRFEMKKDDALENVKKDLRKNSQN